MHKETLSLTRSYAMIRGRYETGCKEVSPPALCFVLQILHSPILRRFAHHYICTPFAHHYICTPFGHTYILQPTWTLAWSRSAELSCVAAWGKQRVTPANYLLNPRQRIWSIPQTLQECQVGSCREDFRWGAVSWPLSKRLNLPCPYSAQKPTCLSVVPGLSAPKNHSSASAHTLAVLHIPSCCSSCSMGQNSSSVGLGAILEGSEDHR